MDSSKVYNSVTPKLAKCMTNDRPIPYTTPGAHRCPSPLMMHGSPASLSSRSFGRRSMQDAGPATVPERASAGHASMWCAISVPSPPDSCAGEVVGWYGPKSEGTAKSTAGAIGPSSAPLLPYDHLNHRRSDTAHFSHTHGKTNPVVGYQGRVHQRDLTPLTTRDAS